MNFTRRTLISRGAALATTSMLAGSGLSVRSRALAQGAAGQPMPEVKALVFDTFGSGQMRPRSSTRANSPGSVRRRTTPAMPIS